MEDTKKVNWKPEDNNYLNKIFDSIELGIAFSIILAPLIASLICLLGVDIDFLNTLLIIYCIFVMTKIVSISVNIRFFKFRKLDLLAILALILLFMLCVTEIINAPIAFSFVFTMGYFLVFLIFTKLEKKYYKSLLFTFILTIVVCSIMGVCDLNNSYMPGFNEKFYPMSLQFYNSNYSAYITTMAILLVIYALWEYKRKWEQITLWLAYIVLNVCLFINGCFSAETAMFFGELILIIYLWIKNKKCPWLILICLLISIAASFVWIKGYSTSTANYMFEMLSVIDNKLGTNLVKQVSTFFDRLFGTGVITSVAGSDGWDRDRFIKDALLAITESPKSFLFGHGELYNNNILVHNVYLQILLEYGVVNLLLYLAIIIVLVIRLLKTKLCSHNVFLVALVVSMILICHNFGCLEPCAFTYFIAIFAVLIRSINERWKERKESLKAETNLNIEVIKETEQKQLEK